MRQASFILILAFLIVSGCSGPPNKTQLAENLKVASELHAKGLKLYGEKRYFEAIQVWEEELKLTPNNANVANNLGIIYKRLGMTERAFEYYKRALQKDPKFFRAYYGLGILHYESKDYNQAKESFLEAVKLNNSDADAYYWLGKSYVALNNCEEGIKAYDKAVKLKPSYNWVHYALGKCGGLGIGKLVLEKQGEGVKREIRASRREAALEKIAHLEMETRRDPANADNFFALAMTYKDMWNWEKAIEVFKKVVGLKPSYPEVHFNLGEIYEIKGENDKARDQYMKELEFRQHEAALRSLEELEAKWEGKIDMSMIYHGNSAFEGISFPQKGIVVSEKAGLYEGPLMLIRVGELPKGAWVTIKNISDRTVRDKEGNEEWYYLLEEGKGLIKTRELVLENKYTHPTYSSPNKKIQVIKSPVSTVFDVDTTNYFSFWFKLGDGKVIFVGEYSDPEFCEKDVEAAWSADEGHVFVKGKVFSANGAIEWSPKEQYRSPSWYKDTLFVRGVGPNDAVYSLNIATKVFKKFLDIPEGDHLEGGFDCSTRVWGPVKIEGAFVKVVFTRGNLEPSGCTDIEVTSDLNGKIIKRRKESVGCI